MDLQAPDEVRAEIERVLLEDIRNCPPSADLLITFFSAALSSYRRATVCNPFPDHLYNDGVPNYDAAISALHEIPAVKDILRRGLSSLSWDALLLLQWILCMENQIVRHCGPNRNRSSKENFSRPGTLSFEIVQLANAGQVLPDRGDSGDIYSAFHGSPLENWHSIIRSGFNANLGKDTSIFGKGTYFAFDAKVSEAFLSFGEAWRHSSFNSKIGCIAGCSVQTDAGRIVSPDDGKDAGKVSESNYLVVQDTSAIRITHLYVYQYVAPASSTSLFSNFALLFYLALLLYIGYLKS